MKSKKKLEKVKLEIKIESDREIVSVALSRLTDLDRDRAGAYMQCRAMLAL